jgi:hypothetical protein
LTLSALYRVTIIHTVPDYDRWAEAIAGSRRHMPWIERMTVHRSVDDPNEVMVELEVSSLDAARAMLQSPDLREVMDRAGIDFYPPVFIGEQVDDLSS